MKRVSRIAVITTGIIGSLFLIASLVLFIFKNRLSSISTDDVTQVLSIGVLTLCVFFIASSFAFSSKNLTHRFARLISATIMGTALFFILNMNYEFRFEVGAILVCSSLLVYNLFDLIYRRIKLPQVFLFIPMSILFVYGIVSYINKQSYIMLASSVFVIVLFVSHLCYKASRLSNNQENIENITK